MNNDPTNLIDPTGLAPQLPTGVQDVLNWLFGDPFASRYHSNDAATSDLANTPAMANINAAYKRNHCADGLYCGKFSFKEFFTTTSFVGQSVGGFCAYMTSTGGGETQVDAYNDWGAASGTRNPFANRNNPSVWDMVHNGASVTWPSTVWNDWYGGPMGKMRFWYHWTEKKPCC